MFWEAAIRRAAFIVMFAVMATWENAVPRRALCFPRIVRWPANLAVTALNPIFTFVLLSVTPVGVAELASKKQWGLFHSMSFGGLTSFVHGGRA